NIEKIEKNGTICAVVRSDEVVVTDPQSALDLLMTAKYDVGTKNIVIDAQDLSNIVNRTLRRVRGFNLLRIPPVRMANRINTGGLHK
ncbi:MAG: hypothetical protein SPE01_05835, partial [Candidatus Spyradocola sp.]|nr:hypothetical protein [Candidatus Spyradocola sp.]